MAKMDRQKPKLILFGDSRRPNAKEAMDRFLAFARDRAEVLFACIEGGCPIELLRAADFAVVFGGDGTILAAARELCETQLPVIGVNVGKLGYLAEFSIDEVIDLFDRIVSGSTPVEKRIVLRCRLMREGKAVFSTIALNEVIITAGEPFRMIEVEICIKGQNVAGVVGDGVIVSTPTGSTAYNLSAGGPILSANLEAFVITPICAHSLSFRPIVISSSSQVQMRPVRLNENSMLVVDGQVQNRLGESECVEVTRHEGQFLIVNNPVRTQWDTLAEKLKWAEKPRYR